jgi:WXG100 family type VII secretion target
VADKISAEEGALARGAQAVADARSGIDSRVRAVQGELDQVSGYWQGPNATSYVAMVNSWREKTSKLNAVLNTLEDALKGTASDQQVVADDNASAIGHISSLMG